MLSRIYSPSKTEDGFTLIELLIVVIIIGILAAIALPIFLNQQKAAADASVQSDVRNTIENVQSWEVSHGGTVEANTGAFITAGGKAAISGNNTVGVATNADGSYQVCGYTTNGKNYTGPSAAYTYDSTTGKFQSGTCVSGSDTGGSSSGTVVATPTTMFNYDFESGLQGWSANSGMNVATVTGFNGHNALKLSGTNTSGTESYAYIAVPSGMVTGKSYTLTADIYVSSPTSSVTADVLMGNFYSPFPTTPAVTTANSWQSVTYTFTASTVRPSGNLMFDVNTPTNSNVVMYVDNVKLVQNN